MYYLLKKNALLSSKIKVDIEEGEEGFKVLLEKGFKANSTVLGALLQVCRQI